MSYQDNFTLKCSECDYEFTARLYTSIWGEYPENRELVMTDKINVITCPSCKMSEKVIMSLLYTNVEMGFAVWWEPYYDEGIDRQVKLAVKAGKLMTSIANAPRINNWEEFKQTILMFEQEKNNDTINDTPNNRQDNIIGENMKSLPNSVLNICKYFFEVLIKRFLELENKMRKNTGFLSLFKKISFLEFAKSFEHFADCAIEAKNELLKNNQSEIGTESYILLCKLSECLDIYVNMVNTQKDINLNLQAKADGKEYDWQKYKKQLKFFDMLRSSLEAELPKLNSLYTSMLLK